MIELWNQISVYFKLDYWVIIGFFGQFIFFARFVVQWIHSERHKQSLIPIQFWDLSIFGALIIFVYAVQRRDPVFFLGQLLAIMIYVRNLHLIKKQARKQKEYDTENR